MNINDTADALIELLHAEATAPDTQSPYLVQTDLMDALNVHSRHTMSDIVTRAAGRVVDSHPGYAIFCSRELGYRLGPRATKEELVKERTRLRRCRTMLRRTGIALNAQRNGPLARLVGRQLVAFVTTMVDPVLESMDEIVEAAR